jgi:hypothetical protein
VALCIGPNQAHPMPVINTSDVAMRKSQTVRRVISTMSTLAVKTMLNPTSIRIAFTRTPLVASATPNHTCSERP